MLQVFVSLQQYVNKMPRSVGRLEGPCLAGPVGRVARPAFSPSPSVAWAAQLALMLCASVIYGLLGTVLLQFNGCIAQWS